MADEGMLRMSLNGTSVNLTVTSQDRVVTNWIEEKPAMADEGMLRMSLNGTTVNLTVTSQDGVVTNWIEEIEGIKRYRHIGIGVEGDLAAHSIQLYAHERCLLYRLLPPLRIGQKLLDFLSNDNHVFIGQPQVESKIAAAAAAQGNALLIKNWINGPAAQDYMTEALLTPNLDNNGEELNHNVLKTLCLNAMAGWLFARGRPPADN